jgi:hypothetical protein
MIIHDRFPDTIEVDGAHFSITPHEYPHRRTSTIRVGTRSFRSMGPTGTNEWETSHRQGQYYQEYRTAIFPHAIIRVHGAIDVHVYGATERALRLLDNTFPLVPPDHLRLVIAEKTAGFRVGSTAGLGRAASYMGGANPTHDNRATAYDERRSIQITFGSLWEHDRRNINPTTFHEIGHVLTHGNNGLRIRGIDQERSDQLSRLEVSRNKPERRSLEGLCNAYMYFICYGSRDQTVHSYGKGHGIQGDRRTRNALRQCRAFTRLDAEWQRQFSER